MAISITDPVSRAFNRAKYITFQPFNLGKWFVFGFIAWLATLGESGGNFRMPSGGGGGGTTPTVPAPAPTTAPFPGRATTFRASWSATPEPGLKDLKELANWFSSHVALAILIALVIVVVVFAIWLLIIWINSRAQFMFLESIAKNTYEVREPWNRFRPLGNSLFGFRIALAGVGFGVTILVIALGLAIAWSDIRAKNFGGGAIAALLLALLILLPIGIFLTLVQWATSQFITTIMYARGTTVLPAWSEFRYSVLAGNIGKFVLFLLMQIVLAIGVGIGQMIIGCATCCVGFLPYLSSVVTLPLLIFMRAYPIYFLEQFGPQYMIIAEPPPPAPPAYDFPAGPPPTHPPPPLNRD